MTTPDILIDDRAGSRDLVKYPPLNATAELARLPAGDVAIPGDGPDGQVLVGVEVKSIDDLLASASSGRLQDTQLRGMREEFDVIYLLYYGRCRQAIRGKALQIYRGGRWVGYKLGGPKSKRDPVPYRYLEAFLLTVEASGVKVKQVGDVRQAAAWIGALARWWSKPWGKHRGLRVFDNSRGIVRTPKMDAGFYLRARVASQLPSMGYERSIAAAAHFPSVEAMVGATVDEWAEVPGVAKGIGRAIVEAVR